MSIRSVANGLAEIALEARAVTDAGVSIDGDELDKVADEIYVDLHLDLKSNIGKTEFRTFFNQLLGESPLNKFIDKIMKDYNATR